MIKDRGKYSYNSGYGYEEHEQDNELWVADFGSHDIERSLREELDKIKPKAPRYVSWALAALLLFVVVFSLEWIIRSLAAGSFLSEVAIFWLIWLWRLVALFLWYYLVRWRWLLDWRRLFVMTISAFIAAVVVADILKIFYIQSAWTWLNLIVDPIWMVVAIAISGWFFYKLTNSAKGGK